MESECKRNCRQYAITVILYLQVRCSRLLYTLCVEDTDKADKLKQSLPPGECSVLWLTFALSGGIGLARCRCAAVLQRWPGSGNQGRRPSFWNAQRCSSRWQPLQGRMVYIMAYSS